MRAREMCIQLADFLRTSLRLGERASIPFREEIELTRMYLGVEQVRFGQSCRSALDVAPACGDCEVPALLIQPLVENAVKHGIALLDRGRRNSDAGTAWERTGCGSRSRIHTIRLAPASRSGIGLANVRQRLEARYGSAARLEVEASEDVYRVTLVLPVRHMHEECVIADDEELARRVLREYLEKEAGIEIVAECGNGFEAVKAVAEHSPDVIFLDIQMPKLDGFEVLELIDRASCRGVRDRVRSVCDAGVRCGGGGLPFEAVRRGPFSRRAAEESSSGSGEMRPASLPAELSNAARPAGEYLERIVVKDGSAACM